MDELLSALDANWHGHEAMQQLFATKPPKFGNDNDYVDQIAVEVVEHFFGELRKHRTYRGGVFTGGSSVFVRGPRFGKKVGATPDGRYAHVTLADSVGPVQGKDVNGPTAVLKSVSKIDHTLACSGYVLNLKFAKEIFASQDTRDKIIALFDTFFSLGGQQVQVNVLSAEELRQAKLCPELYTNLIVRVGGFSEYFVNLSRVLQDEIISRTAHSL